MISHTSLLGLALAGLLGTTPQEAPPAKELLNAFRKHVEKARTLRVEFSYPIHTTLQWIGTIKVKGEDRFAMESSFSQGDFGLRVAQRCNGRRIIYLTPPLGRKETSTPNPKREVSIIKIWLLASFDGISADKDFSYEEIRDVGRDRDSRVIEYKLRLSSKRSLHVKAWFDPASGILLKRETTDNGRLSTETFSAFVINEDIPDSDFSFQSKSRLARARLRQLRRSVELFMTYTGRCPQTPEDLARRPGWLEPDVFWPEGGFVLGNKAPFRLEVRNRRAVLSSPDGNVTLETGPASRRAVGALTDRLRKFFTARVQIQLLASALRAYAETYSETPKKLEDLARRPNWAEVWPDGGWLPGGEAPRDPWGGAYRLTTSGNYVSVGVQDAQARILHPDDLTAEERKALENTAHPHLSKEDRKEILRLIGLFAEDDISIRDKAETALRAFGSAIVPIIDAQLEKPPADPEVLGRLTAARSNIPGSCPAWISELTRLHIGAPRFSDVPPFTADRTCPFNLRQLWRMANTYASKFGGRNWLMCKETGKAFWLAMSKTDPPLIDKSVYESFLCPGSGAGFCTYAGPAKDVNGMGDDDIVGLCDEEAHGDKVFILRKTGDVSSYPRGGAGHEKALRSTRR